MLRNVYISSNTILSINTHEFCSVVCDSAFISQTLAFTARIGDSVSNNNMYLYCQCHSLHLHLIFCPAGVWTWSVPPNCTEVWWYSMEKGITYEGLQHLSWSCWKCVHIPRALSANWGMAKQENIMFFSDDPFIDRFLNSWYPIYCKVLL
jgi:hypothetical protein